MDVVDALVDEVVAEMREVGTERRRELAGRSHPSALEILGVDTPGLRKIERGVVQRLRDAPVDQVVRVVQALAHAGIHEARQLAYGVLWADKRALWALTPEQVVDLGRGNDNWGSVDGYGLLVAGQHWREGRLGDEVVEGWARSSDRWERRTALVCTVALNLRSRGGTGQPGPTMEICALLAGDRDDKVAKAMSWALRELAKREPAAVRAFLAEHDEVLPARVRREVRSKLDTGLKNPR